jgi:uncharacterized membrane protein YphA (DoxX/SURF4 family)
MLFYEIHSPTQTEIMLHADHSIWQIIAHGMIAFLFLFRGVTAIAKFSDHSARINSRGVPYSNLVLAGGLVIMLMGGAMVGLDYYAWIGASMLITFTLSANYIYHNFWEMEGELANRHLYTFFNNVAVMGGLILVITSS